MFLIFGLFFLVWFGFFVIVVGCGFCFCFHFKQAYKNKMLDLKGKLRSFCSRVIYSLKTRNSYVQVIKIVLEAGCGGAHL